MKAVILAAGQGTRLRPITDTVPKCLVPVQGVSILDRMLARVADAGIEHVIVVSGYLHEVLERHLAARPSATPRIDVVFNARYADWGNFYSLLVAQEAIGGDSFIKLDGDVILDAHILPGLMAASGPAVLALDQRDALTAEDMKARVDDAGRIVELNKRMPPNSALGESIGVDRIDAELGPRLFAALRAMIDDGQTDEYYEYAYEQLIQGGVRFSYTNITDALWCEIDDQDDLARAADIVARQARA